MKPVAVMLTGRSACGKGTQAKGILDLGHRVMRAPATLATGAFFRKLNEQGPWDTFTREIFPRLDFGLMAKGELLPDEETNAIVKYIYDSIPSEANLLVIDGVPRTASQTQFLKELLTDDGWSLWAINLDVSRDVAIGWQINRNEGRPDDACRKVIERRHDVYEDHAQVVRRLLLSWCDYFFRINGENSPQKVSDDIAKQLGQHLVAQRRAQTSVA